MTISHFHRTSPSDLIISYSTELYKSHLINLTLLETHTQSTGQIPDSFSTAEDLYLSQDGRGRGTDTKTSSEILWSRTDHFNYWLETVFVVESDQRSFYYPKAKIKLWHLPEIELLSSGKEEMALSGKNFFEKRSRVEKKNPCFCCIQG